MNVIKIISKEAVLPSLKDTEIKENEYATN